MATSLIPLVLNHILTLWGYRSPSYSAPDLLMVSNWENATLHMSRDLRSRYCRTLNLTPRPSHISTHVKSCRVKSTYRHSANATFTSKNMLRSVYIVIILIKGSLRYN